MTKEEAWNRIDAIITKNEVDDEYVTITNGKDYDALRYARKALEQEPCEDAVSRNAVEKMLKARGQKAVMTFDYFIELLYKLPTVTPQPKTGHWETSGDYFTGAYETIDYVRCSRCGYDSLEEGNYCPNCGAKMED